VRIAIDARKIADYGIGTYIRGLLHGLSQLPHDDEYVVLAPLSANELLPRDERFGLLREEAPHYSIRELISVGRSAAAARAELLHAPHYVVPFTSLPLVVTIHDLIHLHHAGQLRNPIAPLYARWMLGRAARRARRILTVSSAVRDDLISTMHADAAKIVVTPNGVDEHFFAPADRTSLPAQLQTSRFFLFVGNDKPHKNVQRLVDAWSSIANRLPDTLLVLAGGDFRRFESQRIVATGFVDDSTLAALFASAVAVVQPSLDEGFGLPAAEALASGTPVITSNAAALVEVTGDAALHVDALDVEAIGAAMVRLANDSELHALLAVRARQRAASFSWRRCAELTHAAYLSAAAKH
jgi:alpha-1,3-rhamnosyl/mannosyltransferase